MQLSKKGRPCKDEMKKKEKRKIELKSFVHVDIGARSFAFNIATLHAS